MGNGIIGLTLRDAKVASFDNRIVVVFETLGAEPRREPFGDPLPYKGTLMVDFSQIEVVDVKHKIWKISGKVWSQIRLVESGEYRSAEGEVVDSEYDEGMQRGWLDFRKDMDAGSV